MINATLDVSRIEAGQLPVNWEDVNLALLIDELRGEIEVPAADSGVCLRWDIQPTPVRLRSDHVKLKVILKNLISNALKFTAVGVVMVSAFTQDETLHLRVADSGIGIAPDLHEAVFEPFRQADSATTRLYGGVGLGLYIVRRLVEMIGGTISLESELGAGARFEVVLPLVSSHPETP